MKKTLIASLIALSTLSANALEVGVTASRDYAGTDRNGGGITVGETFGKYSATVGAERFTSGKNDQNRYSLMGGYNVGNIGPVGFGLKGGVAYLDNQRGADGFALVAGLGSTLPITKQVSATLDYTRQYGQHRVAASDSGKVTAGLKYTF